MGNQAVCTAIASIHMLRFVYDGAIRMVEPYCHGANARGVEVLRAYQIAGGSVRGEHTGWKFFVVSKIHHAEVTGDSFAIRQDAELAGADMIGIHRCRADPA
jgi:hypothetical protein